MRVIRDVPINGAGGWQCVDISEISGGMYLRESDITDFNIKFSGISGRLLYRDNKYRAYAEIDNPGATRAMTVSTVSGDVTIR